MIEICAFKFRDLIPDTKDLLKWLWTCVWRALTGMILHVAFSDRDSRNHVKAGWRYRPIWRTPMGLYTHPDNGWFVVVPWLVGENGRYYWDLAAVWHRWSVMSVREVPPEPPCESLRELEKALTEWLGARRFYEDKNIPHKIGVLLHGPPGSGKTQFVKRVMSLVLASGFTGIVSDVFRITTNTRPDESTVISYPTNWAVAVWEDFDRYYHGDTGVKENMPPFADVLRMLDERLGITFVTVNDISKLDPAVAEVRSDGSISRPGRIDYVVYVGVADERGRRACASNLLAEWPDLIDPTVAAGEGETIAQFQNRCKKLAVARYWEGRSEVAGRQPVPEVVVESSDGWKEPVFAEADSNRPSTRYHDSNPGTAIPGRATPKRGFGS